MPFFLRPFYSVTRACVGMRWLPLQPEQSYKEKPPPLGVTPNINIRHGDMHANNVLVGGLDADDEEHRISPIIKVTAIPTKSHRKEQPPPPPEAVLRN